MRLQQLATVALLAVFCAPTAEANTVYVDVTYTGLVSGNDSYGLFGTPVHYANASFTAHYYADSAGNIGSLTINGQSVGLYDWGDQVILGYSRRDSGFVVLPPSFVPGYVFGYMSNTLASNQTPQDAVTPYSASGTNDPALGSGWNNLYFEMHDLAQGYFVEGLSFLDQTITVGPMVSAGGPILGPMPEPEAWALLVAGFACVGGVLRFRRSSVRLGHLSGVSGQ